jgi:O-antigen/teichoic acid export membrane protein
MDSRSRARGVSRVLAESGWVVAGQVAFAVASLIGLRGLTEVLRPSDYGQLALAMTFVTLFHQCAFGPLSSALGRFYFHALSEGSLRELLAIWRESASQLSFLALMLGGAFALGLAVGIDSTLAVAFLIASAIAVLAGIDSNAEALNTSARRRRLVALVQASRGVLGFGGAIVGAYVFGGTSTVALSGYLAGLALVGISHAAVAVKMLSAAPGRRPVEHREDSLPRRRQELRSYAWPFAAWGLFSWVQFASDRWALEIFISTDEVGLYNAVFQLGHYPVILGVTMLTAYAHPIIFGTAQMDRSVANRRTYYLAGAAACATIVAMLGAFALQDLVAQVLLAAEYRGVIRYLPYMVFAAGLFACGQVLALVPLAAMRSRSLLVPAILASSVGAILTFTFAARWAITGVVIANTVYGMLHCGAMAWVAVRTPLVDRPSL